MAIGIKVGLFDAEVEFDRAGHVMAIEVHSDDVAQPLRLDIAELVRERVQLRRSHGVDFAEMGGRPAAYHAQKRICFVTLAASLEKAFEDDIIDYPADIEDERGIA